MTYDLAELVRSAGRKGTVTMEAVTPSAAEEQAEAVAVNRMLSIWRAQIPDIVATFEAAQALEAYRQAIRSDSPDEIIRIINFVLSLIAGEAERMREDATKRARKSKERHNKEFAIKINIATGVDVRPFQASDPFETALQAAIQNNVSRVTAMTNAQRRKVEGIVWEAWQNKRTPAQVSKALKQELTIPAARAKLIARDQMSKMYGAMDQIRQTEAGIKQYVWMTVGDHRVRPKHAARHGKKYAWKKPPQGGHPSTEVNCRCRARPFLKL